MNDNSVRDRLADENFNSSLPYQKFSIIYDAVMRHVEYVRWARYVKKIIRRSNLFSAMLLDVGCGTGMFISKLHKHGIDGDGCDPSPDMLKLARERNPKHNFWIDRLPELNDVPERRYNVITCLYDTMNYLPSLQALEDSLKRICDILPDKGLFIFDVVSEDFCLHYFHHASDQEAFGDDYAFYRYSYYDVKSRQLTNEVEIYSPGGLFKEKHVQTIFAFNKIREIVLQKTDFVIKGIYEDFTFYEADEASNRAHFVLRKRG